MYDSNRIKNKQLDLTLDLILSRVSEYDIYARYIGQFKIGNIYNSPLRQDKNPSFGIFYSKRTNKLLFKDHGSGECGDVIKFVSLYTGLTNYHDILQRIVDDMSLTNTTKLKSKKQIDYTPTETVIGVVRQDFTEVDKQYWSQFSIKESTLQKFRVSSIKYYLCNGIVKGIYKNENPMYAYKVYDHYKIYRPLGDKYTKWRNNLDPLDIQGYEQLPKSGDLLIITKSMKDIMCFYEMGYNAISPSSESTWFTPDFIEAILKRFKHVLICFDRDSTGVEYLRKLSLKTGLNGFLIAKKFKAKDLSDAIKNKGFDTVKKWLDKTLAKEIEYDNKRINRRVKTDKERTR